MKYILIWLITFYQKVLSLDQGVVPLFLGLRKQVCIYYPTCSEYSKEAIKKYGVVKGIRLTASRVARCTPLHEPRVDLVP